MALSAEEILCMTSIHNGQYKSRVRVNDDLTYALLSDILTALQLVICAT